MFNGWGWVFPVAGTMGLLTLYLAMRSLRSRRSGGSSTLRRFPSQPIGACHYRIGEMS